VRDTRCGIPGAGYQRRADAPCAAPETRRAGGAGRSGLLYAGRLLHRLPPAERGGSGRGAERAGLWAGQRQRPAAKTSGKDQPLADTFLTARAHPTPALPSSGHPAAGSYLTDSGFEGHAPHETWVEVAAAFVLSLPNRARTIASPGWTAPARRLVAGLRAIVETAHFRLLTTFRLEHERPPTLAGFQARRFAKMAGYTCCLWLNHQFGRPLLAFADLLDW
jgi:hypothetical protein